MTIIGSLLVHGTALILNVSGNAICTCDALDDFKHCTVSEVTNFSDTYKQISLTQLTGRNKIVYASGRIRFYCRVGWGEDE